MNLTLVYVLIVLLVAYVSWGLALYIMQPRLLYSPMREVIYTPDELGLVFENVIFNSRDGVRLHGWYIPCKKAQFTLLFCHGNGGNVMHSLDSINIFHNMGLSCFVFDYRGYGNSEGKTTESGTYLDAMAAYKWLTETKKFAPEKTILFGSSLGASIAAQLAGKVRAAALVIESGFTSYVDIGRKFYPYMPVRWFTRFNYNTLDYIKAVGCPVMIIHSRDDELVPFEFGLQLYEAANEPKEFVEIFGSHNDGFVVSSEIYKQAWSKWLKFLDEYSGNEGLSHQPFQWYN
jgi:hypothetical protein